MPSDKDIKKLLKHIEGSELEKAVLLTAFGTLRREEICALTDRDIHGDSITINKSVVRSDKGGMITKSPKNLSSNRVVEYPHFVIEKFDGIQGRLVNMHAIGIPDQYIMARGGWKTDTVLKSVYRNVINDEQKKFTNKINSHFTSMQHEMQHKK